LYEESIIPKSEKHWWCKY